MSPRSLSLSLSRFFSLVNDTGRYAVVERVAFSHARLLRQARPLDKYNAVFRRGEKGGGKVVLPWSDSTPLRLDVWIAMGSSVRCIVIVDPSANESFRGIRMVLNGSNMNYSEGKRFVDSWIAMGSSLACDCESKWNR